YVHGRVRHLVGEPLLHLEPAGKHLDHAWDLGETDQAAVRQVGDVRPTEEGQQVVLAQRVDLDVAHAHQVLVPLAVQGITDHVRDALFVPSGEPLEGRLDAGRRLTHVLRAPVLADLIAWGAEAAQFLISQGLALAILAWLQTLPEFAVEAVIAWDAGQEPERAHLAIANLTGAIRLLLGLGWPMIYFVFAVSSRRRAAGGTQHAAPLLPAIRLEREHAVEIIGLVPPLLYFGVILFKQTLSWVDAV